MTARRENRPLPVQPPPVREILAREALRDPMRALVDFDDRSLTVGALADESRRIAAGLKSWGVARGEPVAIMIGNRSEYLTAFFATAWIGAIAVPVNVTLKGATLVHVMRVTKPRLAIVDAPLLDRLRDAVAAGGVPMDLFVIADEGAAHPDGAAPFASLLADGDGFEPEDLGPGDPCCVIFTSGTTGPSKGVLLPHQQIASAAWDAAHDLDMDAASVFYTFNPLFHLNGLIYGPLAALYAGARAVVRGAFPRGRTLDDMRAAGATHWTIPPFLVRGLLAAPPLETDADNPLRYVMTIGVTEAQATAFTRRFGCRLLAGYGTTEAGMICRLQDERPSTAGRVSDRCELRVVGADGRDVPRGEVGELWVRARLPFDRMLGYYNDPQATVAAFSGDWLRTGDLGYIDQMGYVHFVDRLKESLKRRGANISTFEVEKVLMSFPGVANAAVVGYRPMVDAEEEVRAFVELTDPGVASNFDYRGLVDHCARNLAYFMVPRFIDVSTNLPRTTLGKIRKQELKALPASPSTFDVKSAGIEVQR